MNIRIVFTNPNGSCGVIIPTGVISITDVIAKDVPAGATNIRQITVTELPQDRLFRSAWDDSNPEDFIGTSLVKAKLIAHVMRQEDREFKLLPLDNEERYTSTSNARKNEIVVEKNNILAANSILQTDIDSALNESELRSVLIALI